ncbi:transcriptional regulator with XRE-family HTH domain [Arthrobacter agilis]|nr:transcriptional regulator with XRE-family HTH domain [Arthrobacter agilis]
MITGEQIRAARERAALTQGQLGERVGVSLRTIGNWERGESVPRNKEGVLRSALGDFLPNRDSQAPPLDSASDAELLAEVARRFARTTHYPEKPGVDPAEDITQLPRLPRK